ncbi:MAG TPA: hypothetical protein VFM09_11130 [Marmoricola sp.]|nr:hypothetical protein [Marmoricola sp.]
MGKRLVRTLPVVGLLVVGLAGPAAAAVVNGTDGPDVLVGTSKADTIRGYGGGDKIYAKAGADHVYTGKDRQRDRVFAGPGADRIHAWTGDYVHAGSGNDVIRVRSVKVMATTTIWCGPGYDRVVGLSSVTFYKGTHGCEVVD